jgi:hypothetical protein
MRQRDANGDAGKTPYWVTILVGAMWLIGVTVTAFITNLYDQASYNEKFAEVVQKAIPKSQ